jgi:hypothetical protein
MFLKLGLSITMILQAKMYFKKTYKYFANKELLIEESVQVIHTEVNTIINTITSQDFNAIEEFWNQTECLKTCLSLLILQSVYQLKKALPEVYRTNWSSRNVRVCFRKYWKGRRLYRKDLKCRCIRQVLLYKIFFDQRKYRSEREAFALEMKHYNTIPEPWQQTRHTRIRKNLIKSAYKMRNTIILMTVLLFKFNAQEQKKALL